MHGILEEIRVRISSIGREVDLEDLIKEGRNLKVKGEESQRGGQVA